jgi:predicted aspartyl protease
MSQFKAKVIIWKPGHPASRASVQLLVDTGATLNWVPRPVLERIGVKATERRSFETIEGRIIERDVAAVEARTDGRSSGINVVFAEKGDSAVLGAQALEGFGVAADVVRKRLVPSVSLAVMSQRVEE